MLSSLTDGFEKYPSYQFLRTYSQNNSVLLYNKQTQLNQKKAVVEMKKRVQAKMEADVSAFKKGHMLQEGVNIMPDQETSILDSQFTKKAPQILNNDPVSLTEQAPAVGHGLHNNIPGMHNKKAKGSGKKRRTSMYDYLV